MPLITLGTTARSVAAVYAAAIALTSTTAFAGPVLISRSLTGLHLTSGSSRYSTVATASRADLGSFSDLLAARDVSVQLVDKTSSKINMFKCSSFAFEFKDQVARCDVEGTGQSVVFDMNASEVAYYPLR